MSYQQRLATPRWVSLALGLLATATTAAAAPFPPSAALVNDSTGRLTAAEVTTLTEASKAVAREHAIEVVVVVIESVEEYRPGSQIEPFATALFDHRGIGDPVRNDGVLLLAAMTDRKVRFELGRSYGRRFDNATQRLIDSKLVPRLRQGDLSGALLAGIEGIPNVLTEPAGPPDARSLARDPQPQRTGSKPRRTRPASKPTSSTGLQAVLGWGATGTLLVALAFAWRAFRRRLPTSCPRCSYKMVRLSELDEDVYLEHGQQAEEEIGSVDHDVWFCRKCAERVTKSYASWFRKTSHCPECAFRTIAVNRVTLEAATETSTGVREITETCVACDYEVSWQEEIPMVSTFDDDDWSSGGGGGGGGGSSGGGGATGSW